MDCSIVFWSVTLDNMVFISSTWRLDPSGWLVIRSFLILSVVDARLAILDGAVSVRTRLSYNHRRIVSVATSQKHTIKFKISQSYNERNKTFHTCNNNNKTRFNYYTICVFGFFLRFHRLFIEFSILFAYTIRLNINMTIIM